MGKIILHIQDVCLCVGGLTSQLFGAFSQNNSILKSPMSVCRVTACEISAITAH